MSNVIYRHGIASLLFLAWVMALFTWVTVQVFSGKPPDIPGGTVAAYGTFFGLPALGIGLYQWRNKASGDAG